MSNIFKYKLIHKIEIILLYKEMTNSKFIKYKSLSIDNIYFKWTE